MVTLNGGSPGPLDADMMPTREPKSNPTLYVQSFNLPSMDDDAVHRINGQWARSREGRGRGVTHNEHNGEREERRESSLETGRVIYV